jgi:hyperosmotically inducible protein
MRKAALVLLVSLAVVGQAFALQGSATTKETKKAAQPKKTQVDCSKVDDATITQQIKEKLSQSKSLKDQTINVETTGGVVTLTGQVKTAGQKGLATRTAKRVQCVKSVNNQLTIEKGATPATPPEKKPTTKKETKKQ